MPLSRAAPRTKEHARNIAIEGFQREDGLWDIEGTLTDAKTFDFANADKMRPAGTFHHETRVRMTVDAEFNVRDIQARSDSNPYDEYCAAPERSGEAAGSVFPGGILRTGTRVEAAAMRALHPCTKWRMRRWAVTC